MVLLQVSLVLKSLLGGAWLHLQALPLTFRLFAQPRCGNVMSVPCRFAMSPHPPDLHVARIAKAFLRVVHALRELMIVAPVEGEARMEGGVGRNSGRQEET
jgi:hypothetical protein